MNSNRLYLILQPQAAELLDAAAVADHTTHTKGRAEHQPQAKEGGLELQTIKLMYLTAVEQMRCCLASCKLALRELWRC
jgi:hypothetical protein